MAEFHVDENPEVSGLLHKRRGGFGKMMFNAWNYRFFTLSKDGVLLYYDTDMPEVNIYENKPRGKLELRATHFELVKNAFIEGAPTNYTIQICPPNEEKWKLCADTKEDLNRWCTVIERYVHDKSIVGTLSKNQMSFYTSDDDREEQNAMAEEGSPEINQERKSIVKAKLAALSGFSGGSNVRERSQSSSSGSGSHSILNERSNSPDYLGGASSPGKPSVTSAIAPKPIVAPIGIKKAPIMVSTTNAVPLPAAGGSKKRLKVAKQSGFFSADTWESILVAVIVNISIYMILRSSYPWLKAFYFLVINVVVLVILQLRSSRLQNAVAAGVAASSSSNDSTSFLSSSSSSTSASIRAVPIATATSINSVVRDLDSSSSSTVIITNNGANSSNGHSVTSQPVSPDADVAFNKGSGSGKPIAGGTLVQSMLAPLKSPDHSWCKCDSRLFNVRIGPDYNRHKKKAPSGSPLFDAVAVDIFCTKTRADNAAPRFQLPDTSHIDTHHKFVPPIFIVQIQIPSDPPPVFSTVEDGPGWAILIYFMVTEDTCNQLKDLPSASPAVKLFAEWCEKSFTDAAWRGRFKVICSCLNLEELGMPSAITSYNAKPVLIRRTGSLNRGPENSYIEMDIHVHKFNNAAKSCIHMVSSRCGLMYMQIGFVIEGRDDKELPEVLFGCVGVNKPQEDSAEFIFDE